MIVAALGLTALGTAWLVPSNSPLDGVGISVTGHTNISGVPHLVVRFPRILKAKARVPPGHKGWYELALQIQCFFPDGTLTNYFWDDRPSKAHVDQIVRVPLPEGSQRVRIVTAEGRLGSFEDIELPLGLKLPTAHGTYRYVVPSERFSVSDGK